VATLADLPSTTASRPDFHDLCSQVRQWCGSVSCRRSGLKVDDPGVTAFTAIIHVGAILAVIIYFRSEIRRLASLGSAASLS
jgi:hypothetical protein